MLEPARRTRTLRELRSIAKEVGSNDPEAFAELVELAREFDELVKDAANELRTSSGYSWADLARPIGVTRSAVQQKYGKISSRPPCYCRGPIPEDPCGHGETSEGCPAHDPRAREEWQLSLAESA